MRLLGASLVALVTTYDIFKRRVNPQALSDVEAFETQRWVGLLIAYLMIYRECGSFLASAVATGVLAKAI